MLIGEQFQTFCRIILHFSVSKLTCFNNPDYWILQQNYLEDLRSYINPLNAEVNPIYHLLALLGAHCIIHVSKLMIKPYSQ
jgi:hypothetical protein